MLRNWFSILVIFTACAEAGFTQLPPSSAQNVPLAPGATTEIDEAVVAAEAAIVKSDWKSAEAKLAPYLAAHPEDGRALFDAGYAADAENRLEDAAEFYRRAAAANGRPFEAHLSLGLLLARQGKLDEAREELKKATTLPAGDGGPELKARAWRALAQLNASTDSAQAADDLLEALKLSPETPADTLLAAQLAEQTGQPDKAEEAYRSVLVKDPKSTEAQTGLAHLLMSKEKYAEAEKLLREALAQNPDDPALTAQLATALAAQDDAEALPLMEKLHAAHPQDLSVTRMLADLRSQAGDAAGSDKLYAQLLATDPENADLLAGHGRNLIQQLKYAEALAVYDKATRLAPDDGDAWSGLAFAASKAGQPTVTLHALTERSKLLPEVPSTYFLWATAYDALHDRRDAAVYYHHFLDSAAGRFPDQEWQARQRLLVLEKK